MVVSFKDLEPYTDRYGLVHTRSVDPTLKEPTTLNGVCYTGEALALMLSLKSPGIEEGWLQMLAALRSCELEPGLYQRLPKKLGVTDQEGPDDYMGALAGFSGIRECRAADDMIAYGKRTGFIYNNVNPGKFTFSAFMGRFPQIIGQMYWAAHRKGPPLSTAWAIASILFSLRRHWSKDQDGYRFSALLILTHWNLLPSEQSSAFNAAARLWWNALFNMGYDMGEIVGRYIGDPTHPLARLWGEYQADVRATLLDRKP